MEAIAVIKSKSVAIDWSLETNFNKIFYNVKIFNFLNMEHLSQI